MKYSERKISQCILILVSLYNFLLIKRESSSKKEHMDGEKLRFSWKYIAKMFSLKKILLVNVLSNWFIFVRVLGNQGYVSP